MDTGNHGRNVNNTSKMSTTLTIKPNKDRGHSKSHKNKDHGHSKERNENDRGHSKAHDHKDHNLSKEQNETNETRKTKMKTTKKTPNFQG